ncbi:unnamed protein product [Hymenolepis diminuta]|nr:unnamed protein product [Hymenolepis diminuta]
MYQHTFSAFPTNVASQIISIVYGAPKDSSYCTLKGFILSHLFNSPGKCLQQLLSQVEIEYRTPSPLFQRTLSLVGETREDDTILRHLWIKCLPVNVETYLATCGNRSSLDRLA